MHAPTTQCADLEADLMASVVELKNWNQIFGPLATVEELVNPVEKQENKDSLNEAMDDGDIVAQVHYEQASNVEEVSEDKRSNDESEDMTQNGLGTTEIVELCKQLETVCLGTKVGNALELTRNLHYFRAKLLRMRMANVRQVTLDSMWKQ